MQQLEPQVTQQTQMDDNLELVEFDDGSLELHTDDIAVTLSEESAYKLLMSLQNLFIRKSLLS